LNLHVFGRDFLGGLVVELGGVLLVLVFTSPVNSAWLCVCWT